MSIYQQLLAIRYCYLMPKFFFILAIFMANNCFGQHLSDIVISVVSKEQKMSGVLSDAQVQQRKLFRKWYLEDSLDFDAVVYKDLYNNKDEVGKVEKDWPDHQVAIYSVHDSIFFKIISKITYSSDSDNVKMVFTPILCLIDTAKLLTFIGKHNAKYYSSWTLRDFLDRSYVNDGFGLECGMFSLVTEDAYVLARLVKTKDLVELKALASSFLAGDRARGSAVLFFLEIRGSKLPQELHHLMEINQRSTIKIDYCEGCVGGKQRLSDVLDVVHLKYLYQRLQENRLL